MDFGSIFYFRRTMILIYEKKGTEFLNNRRKMIFKEMLLAAALVLAVAIGGKLTDETSKKIPKKATEEMQKENASGKTQKEEEKQKKKKVQEAQETIAPGQYPIMGESPVTLEQMVRYYEESGKTYPSEVLGKGGAPDIESFCQIYIEEARTEGVRAEVAYVQAMKETGWLQFGGDAKIEQYNFAGLGTTGAGTPGESFPDVRTGVRAQVQHLKAYASQEELVNACADTRYSYVARGSAPYVEWLGQKENPTGAGWATAADYGVSIVRMIRILEK